MKLVAYPDAAKKLCTNKALLSMILEVAKEEQNKTSLYTLCHVYEFTKEKNIGEFLRQYAQETMSAAVLTSNFKNDKTLMERITRLLK